MDEAAASGTKGAISPWKAEVIGSHPDEEDGLAVLVRVL
jgi:hypothetical protein